jgi:hypothetical protein
MSKRKIYNLLFEQEEKEKKEFNFEDPPEANVNIQGDAKPKARKSNDSVDDQIDSLILLYESKAIRTDDEESYLNESLIKKTLLALLREQDEPDSEPADATSSKEDSALPDNTTQASEPSGSESVETEEPAKEDIVPDLDVDAFTRRVARLVMNHRHLLRIEDVIVNRAKNFLDENYGDAFVARYLDSLETQFGIEVSELPNEESIKDAPFSIGANPAGAGMSGGS